MQCHGVSILNCILGHAAAAEQQPICKTKLVSAYSNFTLEMIWTVADPLTGHHLADKRCASHRTWSFHFSSLSAGPWSMCCQDVRLMPLSAGFPLYTCCSTHPFFSHCCMVSSSLEVVIDLPRKHQYRRHCLPLSFGIVISLISIFQSPKEKNSPAAYTSTMHLLPRTAKPNHQRTWNSRQQTRHWGGVMAI